MKNKQIAQYGLGSVIILVLALMSGGETQEGIVMFLYYAGAIGIWVFGIWGLVRLIKSKD
ncbi:MAG: hypothetical protein WCO06_01440 [Candidatus Roizmanbacteria bacterium]